MELIRNDLFKKLINDNPNAYVKLNNKLIPIRTELYDFVSVYSAIIETKSTVIQTITHNNLPVICFPSVNDESYEIFDKQLVIGEIPDFTKVDIDTQIYYIIILDQIVVCREDITSLIKNIKFNSGIYSELIDFEINLSNFVHENNIMDIISHFESKLDKCPNDYKCFAKSDEIGYNCKKIHTLTPVTINNTGLVNFIKNLTFYSIIPVENNTEYYACENHVYVASALNMHKENIGYIMTNINGKYYLYNPRPYYRDSNDIIGKEYIFHNAKYKCIRLGKKIEK